MARKRHLKTFKDPIDILHSFMRERDLRAKDLVEILGVSKGLVSDILNHKKGLSKKNIQALAKYFDVEIISMWVIKRKKR